MTRERIEAKILDAAAEGDYIDFRDDIFQTVEEERLGIKHTFYHLDDLTEYLNTKNKIIKDVKCIDGIIRGGGRYTTCNMFKIKIIDEGYDFDELLELGYTFKEINKILKQQEK